MRKIKEVAGDVAGKVTLALMSAGSIATVAHAANVSVDGTSIKPIKVLGAGFTLESIVSNLINVILIAAGVLAVLYLIWGGIMYVTAGGEAEKASKGRVAITNAIIGVIIIMAALAIYNFVISGVQTG